MTSSMGNGRKSVLFLTQKRTYVRGPDRAGPIVKKLTFKKGLTFNPFCGNIVIERRKEKKTCHTKKLIM